MFALTLKGLGGSWFDHVKGNLMTKRQQITYWYTMSFNVNEDKCECFAHDVEIYTKY